MIKFALMSSETNLNIAKALSISELCKGHAIILFEASEVFYFSIALIFFDTASKGVQGQVSHELSKNSWGCVHAPLFAFATENGEFFSNRLQAFF